MAQHLIEDFVESMLNPEGRFRTLQGIYAETDSRDCPLFCIGSRTVVFRTVYHDQPCLLTILTDYTPDERQQAALRAVNTLLGKPYLAECRYLPDEMAVYDPRGSIERFDVILQPANDNIADFVRKNSARSKLKAIRTALESVADAAEVFDREGIIHGSMSTNNLCLDNSLRLLVTDYPLSFSTDKSNDNRALLTAGIMLYLSGCEPNIYRIMGVHGDFAEHRSSLNRRYVVSVAEFYGMDALSRAIKQLDIGLSRETVCRRLVELAAEPFRPMPLLCNMIGDMSDGRIAFSALRREAPSEDPTLTVDFAECQTVGTVQDTLVRYMKNGYWGYADRHGRRLKVDKPLLGAYDFYEGRAVVRTCDGYGLIDREGKWVMEDVFDDLIWYGEANVAVACDRQGKWRLYYRCGKVISEAACDALCDCNEGVIVARRGRKYGYIATDGRQLTDFMYDEAGGFCNGTAPVELNGRRYRIDLQGHETRA